MLTLKQGFSGRILNVRFRLFNDGLGFRYEFPEQPTLNKFVINEELTQFNLAHDYTAFCMPGDYDTNEFTYTTAPLSQIREEMPKQSVAMKSYEAKSAGDLIVQTPLMLKGSNGLYVNIHEAALVDYAAMELNVNDKSFCLTACLVPDKNGDKGFCSQDLWYRRLPLYRLPHSSLHGKSPVSTQKSSHHASQAGCRRSVSRCILVSYQVCPA